MVVVTQIKMGCQKKKNLDSVFCLKIFYKMIVVAIMYANIIYFEDCILNIPLHYDQARKVIN